MFERFSDPARRAMIHAQQEARRLGHGYIGTEHILLGLAHDGRSVAGRVLAASGVSDEVARRQVEEIIGRGTSAPDAHVPFTPRSREVLAAALREALTLGHTTVGTEHLLLALIGESEGVAAQVLVKLGASADRLRAQMMKLVAESPSSSRRSAAVHLPPDALFHRYGTVLADRPTDPRMGRDAEVERIMQILSRRRRYNPMLLGEPGVGKTAVVERLAVRMAGRHAPKDLRGKHVLAIEPALLVAGVRDRAQLDTTIGAVIDEIVKAVHTRAVIFFDDLHELARLHAFDAEIGDVLAPFLNAGYRVVGATTPTRFRQYAERNPVLERDCEPVDIVEPPTGGVVDMLACVRPGLEAHHQMPITDDALQAAVTLARRYRPDRALPGSAIDVLDHTAAMLAVRRYAPPDLRELDERIAQVRRDKEAAIDGQDFERAKQMRDAEKALLNQKRQRERDWEVGDPAVRPEVTGEQVAEMLGVDLNALVTPQAVAYRIQPAGIQLPIRDRSTAILVGAGRFTDGRLPDLPAITHNLHDLRRALTADIGLFEPARVHVFDHVEHGDLKAVATLARATSDTLVVYYAGHGLNENDDLYLAYADTDRDQPQLTGLGYDKVRHIVTSSPARRCIVILDCCYAGKVIEWMGPGDAGAAGELDIRGTYVLTATGMTAKAIAPQGERHTAFTGALLRMLRDGVDNGREFLCVADLHPRLAAELRSRNLPQPRQRPIDSIGSLAISRNVAWRRE